MLSRTPRTLRATTDIEDDPRSVVGRARRRVRTARRQRPVPSTARGSIAASSSSISSAPCSASRLSSSCATDDAPMRALVTAGCRSTQVRASWASDWPRASAMLVQAADALEVGLARASSVNQRPSAAREPAGALPDR